MAGTTYAPERWKVARALLRTPPALGYLLLSVLVPGFVSKLIRGNSTSGSGFHNSVAMGVGLGAVMIAFFVWRMTRVSVTIDDSIGTIVVRNVWHTFRIRVIDLEGVSTGRITLTQSRSSAKFEPALMLDLKNIGSKSQPSILVEAALRNDGKSPLLKAISSICQVRMLLYRVDPQGLTTDAPSPLGEL